MAHSSYVADDYIDLTADDWHDIDRAVEESYKQYEESRKRQNRSQRLKRLKYHRQRAKAEYEAKMFELFRLRQKVNRRADPSMPRLSFRCWLEDRSILECYLKIERWKLSGKEDYNYKYIPPVRIGSY